MPTAKPIVAVIEDDAASAEALSLILKDWGAEAIVAPSATAMQRMLGARIARVGWIITDYNLGIDVINGVDGAQELLALAPEARVLVLSGSFRERGAAAAREAGFELMSKPAQAKAIIGWLERGR